VTHLGSAVSFGVLASSTVTGSAGAGSVITGGDLGLYPGTSVTNFPPSTVTPPGVQHVTDAVAQNAQIDLTAAISFYNGLVATQSGLSNLSTNDGGGGAGVYHAGVFDSVAASSLDIPTTITLDAQGNANAIFVFRAGSTLTLESGAQVLLVNGAQSGNVYWVVGSSFTSIWNGSQSDMVGTIMATASITLGGGTLHGRALASTAAVTMATTETITVPTMSLVAGSVGTPYPAFGVIGSIVLANPGQIAKIAFITTTCVRTGSPLVLGVILNEALPYFQGSFDILKHSVSDPPGLPESHSFYQQRFYLAEDENTSSYAMHLQILVQFPMEAAHNELQTISLFGAYEVEI
jgi:Ice-binding-like